MADNPDFSSKIDREITGAIAIAGQPGGAMLLAPKSLQELMEFAKLMAVSGAAIRPQFRGNPGACLAMLMQALKWNADPWAVSNKAYIVVNKKGEENIAYEAQLIHAIVNTRAPLQHKLSAVYSGKIEDKTRACRITGFLNGESKPSEYQSPMIKQIGVQNSPLWAADPDQQLWYYSTRAWARRYVPEILLGIYTPEEMRGEIIDITAAEEAASKSVEAELDAFAAPAANQGEIDMGLETAAEPQERDPVPEVVEAAETGDAASAGSVEAAELALDELVTIRTLKPARIGRGWDWPGYADAVLEAARELPRDHLGAFRVANAQMLNTLRISNKEQWSRVQQSLADIERDE